MAAITFGTGVIPGANAKLSPEVAGETPMAAGQSVFRDTDGRVKLAQASNAAKKDALGVLSSAVTAIGQPVMVQTDGEMTGASGLTKGEVYVLSATAGSVCPVGDLVSTNHVVFMAVALSTTSFFLRPVISGAVK